MNVKKVTTQAELDKSLEIRHKVFVEEQHVPLELEIDQYDDLSKKEVKHFIIIEENNIAVGTFRCLQEPNKVLHLQRLAVLKEYRSHGIGTFSLAFIKKEAQCESFSKIVLGAQCHAIPFYEKNGFSVCSEIFLDAGIEHREMEFICRA